VEASGNLKARLFRLEQIVAWDDSLPCAGCDRPHLGQALDIDWLRQRFAGEEAPLPPVCTCDCCQPAIADLAARYERRKGAA
jgi:hypothetical protein